MGVLRDLRDLRDVPGGRSGDSKGPGVLGEVQVF